MNDTNIQRYPYKHNGFFSKTGKYLRTRRKFEIEIIKLLTFYSRYWKFGNFKNINTISLRYTGKPFVQVWIDTLIFFSDQICIRSRETYSNEKIPSFLDVFCYTTLQVEEMNQWNLNWMPVGSHTQWKEITRNIVIKIMTVQTKRTRGYQKWKKCEDSPQRYKNRGNCSSLRGLFWMLCDEIFLKNGLAVSFQ